MAFGSSFLFPLTLRDIFINAIALDAGAEDYKLALFNNSLTTPDPDSATAYGVAPFNANEVTGTNWATGGVALTGTGFTVSGGVLTYDATDVSVATVTVEDARGGLFYADTLAGNNGIVAINFGADYTATAGPFQIVWDALGIFYIDCQP